MLSVAIDFDPTSVLNIFLLIAAVSFLLDARCEQMLVAHKVTSN